MSEFQAYLGLGFDHISDLQGYDHILFIVALCAVYKLSQWKQVLILVTAFTVGHSITLALATLKLVTIPQAITEFFIPVTILITALYNVFNGVNEGKSKRQGITYLLALFVGLIHGMGFSNFLASLLGKEASITVPLLSFNIGLELGQLIIVTCILVVAFFVLSVFKAKHRDWNLFVSGAAAGISFIMMLERLPDMLEAW
ncbi:MAG: HupE/UreJ family protein [Flammeovirgaceae bacterium]